MVSELHTFDPSMRSKSARRFAPQVPSFVVNSTVYASSDQSASRRLRRKSLRPNPPSVTPDPRGAEQTRIHVCSAPIVVAVTKAHSGHARYSNGKGGLFDVWSQNYILLPVQHGSVYPRCTGTTWVGLPTTYRLRNLRGAAFDRSDHRPKVPSFVVNSTVYASSDQSASRRL